MTAKGNSKNKPRIDAPPNPASKVKMKVASKVAVPEGRDESVHVSVRKISNGYVVSHSHSSPKGYESHEIYHPKKPRIDIGAVKKAEGTAPPRDT